MYQRKLKSFVIPTLYSIFLIAFIVGIFYVQKVFQSSNKEEDKNNNLVYVVDSLLGDNIPVINQDKAIVRPYTDKDVKVIKTFYDYKAAAESQQNSIIYYENTYMQNSGDDYSNSKASFDVAAILDGTVINVNEDDLLGKIVEIRHTNDLISVYQSLSEISVKKGDTVTQGQVIGKSGTCNLSLDLKDHLHFEILYKGQVADPETFYDKSIKNL